MRSFKIIGLIGPTGSGKTTAAEAFVRLGWSVIDADSLSRRTLVKDSLTLKMLQTVFGGDIADENGEPVRSLIAQRAFSSEENTKILNDITHPAIYMCALSEMKKLIDSGKKKIVFDAPTLLDCNGQLLCDEVVTVTADLGVRAERIIKRDKISREEAMARINAQPPSSFYEKNSDFVFYNNSDLQALYAQLLTAFGEG